MRLGGTYAKSRLLATGKTVYVRLLRGQLIACKWPRKRPRVTHPTTLAQMERFRQANWLAKYAPAPIQMAHRRLVDGTQLLPRDLMVAAMMGRGMFPQLPGELRRYPVAAIKDLSDTLDILGAQPSDILARGPDRWQKVSSIQAGQALVSGVPGQAPQWQTLSGGTGLWQQIEDVTLAVGLGIGVYREVIIPANAGEIEWDLWVPATGTVPRPAMRLNNNNGANYFFAMQGITAGGAYQGTAQSSQLQFIIVQETSLPNGSRIVARGRIWQADIAERVGWFSEANYGGGRMTKANGQWVPPSPQKLNSVGFTSLANAGLMAGTRIIVRAAIT